MEILYSFRLWLSALLIIFSIICDAQAGQFCTRDSLTKTDLCVAIHHSINSSTSRADLTIHIRSVFVDRNGWAAVGLGDRMDDALMFVLCPAETEGTVLSVRTTTTHSPPRPVSVSIANHKPPPQLQIIDQHEERSTSTFSVTFKCFACDKWISRPFSTAESWIWASNYGDELMGDASAALTFHQAYGIFQLNMLGPFTLVTAEVGPPELEDVGSFLDIAVNGQSTSGWLLSNAILSAVHGILLAFAFTILMPTAATLMKLGVENSFQWHWKLQIAAISVVSIGEGIGVFLTRSVFRVHQLFGLVLFTVIVTQAFLGYKHHQRYLLAQKHSALSVWHHWIGRVIILAGFLNVTIGLRKGGFGYIAIIFLTGLELGVLAMIYLAIQKKVGNTNKVAMYDSLQAQEFDLDG